MLLLATFRKIALKCQNTSNAGQESNYEQDSSKGLSEKQDDKIQKTKDKLQKRDIDAYKLSYAQLGHKNKMVLIGPYLSTF